MNNGSGMRPRDVVPISRRLNKDTGTISTMFNGIAHSYDMLNHIFSLNIDKYWRRQMVKFLRASTRERQPKVLDIACGTGDSSIALYKAGMNVSGMDIAQKMLDIAVEKNAPLKRKAAKYDSRHPEAPLPPLPDYIFASAEKLPFETGKFDAVTISFGIRNFNRRSSCLAEIYRVIKPGGVLAILEFAKPQNPVIRFFYNLYFNNVLPFVGKLVSKDKDAYKYLSTSVEAFPKFDAFAQELRDAGFREVNFRKMTFGICVLYTGVK